MCSFEELTRKVSEVSTLPLDLVKLFFKHANEGTCGLKCARKLVFNMIFIKWKNTIQVL